MSEMFDTNAPAASVMAPGTGLAQAMMVLSAIGDAPGIEWKHGDDLCDCLFQRICWWTNPYIAETLVVRVCCIWEQLYKQHPEFVMRVHAFDDYNTGQLVTEPAAWDSKDDDMPRALWYRQLARQTGLSLARVRAEFADADPPKRLPA